MCILYKYDAFYHHHNQKAVLVVVLSRSVENINEQIVQSLFIEFVYVCASYWARGKEWLAMRLLIKRPYVLDNIQIAKAC